LKIIFPYLVKNSPQLWNPKFYYHVDKSQSLVPILSRINPPLALATDSFQILNGVILPPTPKSITRC